MFLVHPGGPYWAKKDRGFWTIPKGEYESDEAPIDAARREFREETGFDAPPGDYLKLGSVKQKSGKEVIAWAAKGDCDPAELVSNTCLIEWPPRSGRQIEIPEVDSGRWFSLDEAEQSIRPEQILFLKKLVALLA